MEELNYQEIVIKTEVENTADNENLDVLRSDVTEKDNNIIYSKLQSDEGLKEEILLANKCKNELEVKIKDEFCNEDASSIYFKESNSSMTKAERTFELSNQMKQITGHKVKSLIPELPLVSSKDPVLEEETEEFLNENKGKLKMQVEKNDKLIDHTYAKSIHMEEFNTSTIKVEETYDTNTVTGAEDSSNQECYQNNYMANGKPSVDQQKKFHLDVDLVQYKEDRPFECDKSDYSSKSWALIKQHQTVHSNVGQCMIKVEDNSLVIPSKKKLLGCSKCSFQTRNKQTLDDHNKSMHKEDMPFKCSKCSYKSKRWSLIKQHQTVHSELGPFKCDKCSYQTYTKNSLKSHRLVHDKEKPFKCDKCKYSGNNKFYFKIHRMMHAQVEEPFKCEKCSYKTKFKQNLRLHQLVHTEERPFKCANCDYASKNKATMRHHQIKHSEAKDFKCPKCGHATKSKALLKKHQTTHEESFKCNVCSFNTKSILSFHNHRLMHTDERPFKCDKCDYSTKTKTTLSRHQRAHSERKCVV